MQERIPDSGGRGGFVKKFNREFSGWLFKWICQYLCLKASRSLFL